MSTTLPGVTHAHDHFITQYTDPNRRPAEPRPSELADAFEVAQRLSLYRSVSDSLGGKAWGRPRLIRGAGSETSTCSRPARMRSNWKWAT